MATIKDIALSSGVVPSTVSEVLNYKPRAEKVTAATKKRIFDAARELNYTPNIVARGLRTGRSMQIGLLLDQVEGSIFPAIIQGIEDVLYDRGYSAIFYIYHTEQDILDKGRFMKQVDGILLYPDSRIPVKTFQSVLKNCPVVTFAGKLKGTNIPSVKVDGEKIGYLATKHLLENGHRKIAFSCTKEENHNRPEGCLKALVEQGLDKDAVHFIHADWSFEKGREIFREIIQQGDITGVFVHSDNYAAGMIYEAASQGIKIPERLSIIGCNDTRIASQVFPKITTVRQPKEKQGAEAAKMLLDMIENNNTSSDKLLAPKLIIRDSVSSI